MKKLGCVDICGIPFEVVLGTREEFVDLDDAYGYTNMVQCRFVLRDGMNAGLFRNTLLHEIQHGIWQQAGLAEIAAKDWNGDFAHYQETHIQIFTPHLIAALASLKKLRVK